MANKKENCEKPDDYDYDNDEAWEFYCNWLKRDNTFVCSILEKKDNQYIGYISIKDTSRNLWELAIELLAEQCNKGYGYRAVSLFLAEVSRITEKKQFQTLVEVDNSIPSQMLMEKLQASLIDIYDYAFGGDEKKAQSFEECHLDRIKDRMRELAKELRGEPRKLLSHVLDYRIFVENGKIVKKSR